MPTLSPARRALHTACCSKPVAGGNGGGGGQRPGPPQETVSTSFGRWRHIVTARARAAVVRPASAPQRAHRPLESTPSRHQRKWRCTALRLAGGRSGGAAAARWGHGGAALGRSGAHMPFEFPILAVLRLSTAIYECLF